MNHARRRGALYLGAAVLLAAIVRVEQELLLRFSAPESPAACPPPPAPRVETGLEARLADYRRLHEMKAPLPELEKAEREIEALAGALGADAFVRTLFLEPSPVAIAFLCRVLEGGLARDREAWEAALVEGLVRLDPRRLEGAAALALARLREEESREAIALHLLEAGRADDRLNALAARYAEGSAAPRVREALWARVPEDGAVEGLGHLVEAPEAFRLASLGNRPSVARALETAWERTGDAAFKDARARLSR